MPNIIEIHKHEINSEEAKAIEKLEELINKPIPLKMFKFPGLIPIKKIQGEVQDSHIIRLWLFDCGLSSIPEEICNLKELKLLDLHNNKLVLLPESMGGLNSLSKLDLINNNLSYLPESFIKLRKTLSSLYIRGNKFKTFPKVLENLKLNYLDIEHELRLKHEQALVIQELEKIIEKKIPYRKNIGISYEKKGFFTNVPKEKIEEWGGIPWSNEFGIKAKDGNVIGLGLNDCGLKEVPEIIGNLNSLKELWLGNLKPSNMGRDSEINNFEKLPQSIGKLKSLEILNLSQVFNLRLLPESIFQLNSLKELDLDECGLIELNENLGNLVSLQVLSFQGHSKTFFNVAPDSIKRLVSIPKSIGALKSLRKLYLTNHNLTSLPESFGNLISLVSLILENNNLTSLPESFGNLKALKELNLKHNMLISLPDSFGNLYSLKELNLDENNLIKLPESFGNLTSLEKLWLGQLKIQVISTKIDRFERRFDKEEMHDLKPNKLKHLPESFGNLRTLKELYLRGNKLEELPDSFRELISLEDLDLSDNKFKELPIPLGYLKNLMKLQIERNPFEGDSEKLLHRYDERKNLIIAEGTEHQIINPFETYIKKRDIPIIQKFLRKRDKEEKEKKKQEEIEKEKSSLIAYLKKLSKVYEEIVFDKLISKTGLEQSVLVNILEDLIINEEINAKIRGNYLVFEEKKPLILPKPEYIVEAGFNIFISYSTLDADKYQIPRIANYLNKHHNIDKAYYWEEDSGENIVDFMERTLRKCKVFILFCSENAIKSQSVEDEWQAAFQLRKRRKMKIVPVYENEDYIPRLLWPLINVKFNREDFISFMEKLFKEIFRK